MCLTSRLLTQQYILVIKATYDKVDLIIDYEKYITEHIPSNKIQCNKFILVSNTRELNDRVLAIGDIKKDYEIQEDIVSKYKYELSNIIDLRQNELALDEIFITADLNKIKKAEEVAYISSLDNTMLA